MSRIICPDAGRTIYHIPIILAMAKMGGFKSQIPNPKLQIPNSKSKK